ncbi:claudin-18-like protein [Labeo rohita]|uniref:Claudin-18-like protein n=1 Tax=Labeo rohita TaxID=84645 RepID=A0A498LTJ1_LABRO|nr:claudin-18-like protein [Labeo rohita]RXN08747.1 claudin-18-like protein [Labeo rohita]RXN17272.1 claudin-18-like protein [Labeo rohita]
MTSQALQTAGFVTGAVGTVGVLAATIMDVWCTDHSENDPASNSHYRGLWKDCEVAESGLAECQSFNSHLSFTSVFDISGSSVYADQLVPSFMVRSPARSTHKSEETGAILCQNGMGMGQITSQDTGKGTGPGHFQVHGQVHGQVYGQGQGQGQVYGQGQGQGQGQVYGQGQGQGMGMGMGSGTGNGMGTGMGTDMGTDMGTGMGTEMGTGMGFDGTESRATRYTFGAALYIAWVAGVLLILAGILKCISFKTMQLF